MQRFILACFAAALVAATWGQPVVEDHAVAHNEQLTEHDTHMDSHHDNTGGDHHDPYEGMNPQQIRMAKAKKQHEEWHRKHKGHEKMHAEMLLVLLLTMVLTQMLVVLWKKNYFESYQAVTLMGMWLIPIYFSVNLHFTRFMTIWTIFTLGTAVVLFQATRSPLHKQTPRRVYTFFMATYKASYIMTFFGYFLSLLDFVGLGVIIQAMIHDRKAHPLMATGLQAMFYGLYFGVLSRDLAEICAGLMASKLGFHTPGKMADKQLPVDVCGICGDTMCKTDEVEKIIKLPCGHEFHEFCVRGWSIIGKKQVCPYCSEKVDLNKLFVQPWSLKRQDVLFSQLLDILRYLVVWQPFIIVASKGINYELGLK